MKHFKKKYFTYEFRGKERAADPADINAEVLASCDKAMLDIKNNCDENPELTTCSDERIERYLTSRGVISKQSYFETTASTYGFSYLVKLPARLGYIKQIHEHSSYSYCWFSSLNV
jgi:hypothetical protein